MLSKIKVRRDYWTITLKTTVHRSILSVQIDCLSHPLICGLLVFQAQHISLCRAGGDECNSRDSSSAWNSDDSIKRHFYTHYDLPLETWQDKVSRHSTVALVWSLSLSFIEFRSWSLSCNQHHILWGWQIFWHGLDWCFLQRGCRKVSHPFEKTAVSRSDRENWGRGGSLFGAEWSSVQSVQGDSEAVFPRLLPTAFEPAAWWVWTSSAHNVHPQTDERSWKGF